MGKYNQPRFPEPRPATDKCPGSTAHHFRKVDGVWKCDHCPQRRDKNGKVINDGERTEGVPEGTPTTSTD